MANRRRARLDVAGVGRFAVQDGVEITVEPEPGDDPDRVRTLLYGLVAAIVLAQRGEFALHASTVAVGSTGLALAGRSGAGKSTAALALECRGHRMVADDISAVRIPARPHEHADPVVLPFGRHRHVWPDTATALGLDLTGSRLVDRRFAKLSLPSPAPGRVAASGIQGRGPAVTARPG